MKHLGILYGIDCDPQSFVRKFVEFASVERVTQFQLAQVVAKQW